MFRKNHTQNNISILNYRIISEAERQQKGSETNPSTLIKSLFKKKSELLIGKIQEQLNSGMLCWEFKRFTKPSVSVDECREYGKNFMQYTDEQMKNTVAALEYCIVEQVKRLVKNREIKIPAQLLRTVEQLENASLAEIARQLIKSYDDQCYADNREGIWKDVFPEEPKAVPGGVRTL